MMLPPLIKSRWVTVPGALVLSIALWNVYVATHAHGMVEGRVVDAGGRPVPNATVTLFERSFVAYVPKGQARTDADGRFRFTDNQNHALQLEAESPVLGKSDRFPIRLWFRAQDYRLTHPLRFAGHQP